MILRAWRGYAAATEPQAYPRHLLHSVRPKLERMAGFRGLYLLRHRGLEEIEFLVLTLWDSMEAVHAFAGDQPEVAVVEPEARAALVRFDDTVRHYEVLAAEGVGVTDQIRGALIEGALAAFEDASVRGLCCEGAWEAAVSAMRQVDLSAAGEQRPGPGGG